MKYIANREFFPPHLRVFAPSLFNSADVTSKSPCAFRVCHATGCACHPVAHKFRNHFCTIFCDFEVQFRCLSTTYDQELHHAVQSNLVNSQSSVKISPVKPGQGWSNQKHFALPQGAGQVSRVSPSRTAFRHFKPQLGVFTPYTLPAPLINSFLEA